jgi:hypothetical protein
MSKDPTSANVTARMIFNGVMLLCENGEQCEVGIVRCPMHNPTLTIETTTAQGTHVDGPHPISKNLLFKVLKPKQSGVRRHESEDERSFKYVPDLEGRDLHGEKVEVFPHKFGVKLAVTAGLLYSHRLRSGEFKIIEWSDQDPAGKPVGRSIRIADLAALNIDCLAEEGSGIDIISRAGTRNLPRLRDGYYTITIDNECLVPDPGPFETDFRFYYQVIKARDGRRFDLRDVAHAPRACEVGFLGKTDTFDFSIEP